MLSGYYFLGLGNDTEGYTLLSGEGLNKAYVFPKTFYSNQIISINPFVNAQDYTQPIFKIPRTAEGVSGYFYPVTEWNNNVLFNANNISKNYSKQNMAYNNSEYFKYNEMFILSSTFNLFKTTNRLYETPDYESSDNYLHENCRYFFANSKKYNHLLVPENLIDISIIRSVTENIYEFLDQYNVSLNDALMSGYMPNWYSDRLGMPMSNYGKDLSTSSEIYSYYEGSTNYDCSKPFFGSTTSSIWEPKEFYSNDVYVKNSENIFEPATSGHNIYENLFNQFTFKETKYILSGSNRFADLYKNQDIYFPVRWYKNSISNNIPNLDYFYISNLGHFTIPSGEYIYKSNNYISATSGTLYHFGEWLSGLNYTPDWGTTMTCENLNISEAVSSDFFTYAEIIGVKRISEDVETYYYNSSDNVLKSIHDVPDKIEVYIAIDPQSYTIAL